MSYCDFCNYSKHDVARTSSAGASSPAVQTNVGSTDWLGSGQGSKAGSQSGIGPQPPKTSLSTNVIAGGSTRGSSQPSCRPWERGDLLCRLATFKPSNWSGKPKVCIQSASSSPNSSYIVY